MSNATSIRRPVLAAHARYRLDPLRQEHQVVFPEGLLVLNDTAAAILSLCDGRPRDGILVALMERFDGVEPGEVDGFLNGLAQRGLLRDADS